MAAILLMLTGASPRCLRLTRPVCCDLQRLIVDIGSGDEEYVQAAMQSLVVLSRKWSTRGVSVFKALSRDK